MADTDDGSTYPGDASGQMNPALDQFVNGLQTDEGRDWAGQATSQIQDYLTKKAVVQQNQAAGEAFATNLAATKQQLVKLVQGDPGATDLALNLASSSVNALAAQHRHLDEDTRTGAASDLIDHMQTEIAHASVQTLAEQDKDTALKALDKYGDYLPDEQQAALRQYADIQDGLRQQDAFAQQQQAHRDAYAKGFQSASGYLSSLADPDTGQFRAPQGFLPQLVADNTVPTRTKLALRAGFGMLMQNGDPPQSHGPTVIDLLDRIGSDRPPLQGEIASHLGTNLTMADAGFLNSLLAPRSPSQRADLRQLGDVARQARDTLATPGNGGAGQIALGRFTNWLLPTLQRGGNLAEATEGNRIQQFAPTAADAVAAMPRSGPRPPLHMIFGGGNG